MLWLTYAEAASPKMNKYMDMDMNTKHTSHPQTHEPSPPSGTTTFARLGTYLDKNRPARLLALGIGLLAIVLVIWLVSDETPDPQTAEHAGEEPVNELDEVGAEFVAFTVAEIEEFNIDVQTAGPGTMAVEKELPGEIRANEDRYAHITPRVAGVVRSVSANVGSYIWAGQTLAIIESRELADLKSEYLSTLEREQLAIASFDREERLYKLEITAEADFLEARQALAEARIRTRSARQKLIALGFSDQYIQTLPEEGERSLVTYPLTAPISGSVVEKHIVTGEAVEAVTDAFEVADLSTVWADFSIYHRDLGIVRKGQDIVILASPGFPRTHGTISYVRPIVGEETRTAIARAVIQNPNGMFRPGQFITGRLTVDAVEVPLVVPTTALVDVEGQTVVFIQTDEGFEARPVQIGERTASQASITSGLTPGDRYVAGGAFALKAELGKSEMEGGHGH